MLKKDIVSGYEIETVHVLWLQGKPVEFSTSVHHRGSLIYEERSYSLKDALKTHAELVALAKKTLAQTTQEDRNNHHPFLLKERFLDS